MIHAQERTLEVIRRANHFLEKSFRDLEVHTEVLEQQRREVLPNPALNEAQEI